MNPLFKKVKELMKNLKHLSAQLLVTLLGVSFILGGCGKDSSESAQSQTTSSETTTVATTDLPDPHSLTGLSEVAEIGDPEPISGTYSQTLPTTVTDFENNQVTISDTSRILALDIYGTLSRTIIALGYGDNLVGRTVSDTEEQLADLPVVTEQGHSLNAEAIINLKPTVVIADRSVGPEEAFNQIKQSGIPLVFVNSQRGLDTNSDLIKSVANALGVSEAGDALAQRTEAEIVAAKEQIALWTPDDPMEVAFLYVRGTASIFFILGPEDGATELIEAVGATDLAAANGIESVAPANAESLATVNPEVIFVMKEGLDSTGGLEGLFARAGVAQTRAGATQRVVSIPDGIALSFGPQTAEILLGVAKALYGVQ